MKTLYTATSKAHDDEQDQTDHHFVSIDGDRYLEIQGPWPLDASHYDEVAEKFGEVAANTDERGGTRHVRYLTLSARYIRVWAREPVFHNPIEVGE